LTWLQRITLFLLLIAVINRLIGAATGSIPLPGAVRVILVILLVVLIPFAILGPIVRRLTWRVRHRLIVTYFLLGVLPIFLVVLFAQMGLLLILGQVTNYLLHQELD